MRMSDQVHNALSTSKDYIDGKMNAQAACELLVAEVQEMQKYDWGQATREFEWQGSQSGSPAAARSVEPSGNVLHPAEQLIIGSIDPDSDKNKEAAKRRIVIEQKRAEDPVTVSVGHLEGKQFVAEASTVVEASQNPSEPSAIVPDTGDDIQGDGMRSLNLDEEAGQLAKLTQSVKESKPGAIDELRLELLQANEIYPDWRTKILEKYNSLVKDQSIIEQTDGQFGLLQLKDAYVPDKNAPESELFGSPKDKLQSISAGAVGKFDAGYSGAFRELLASTAALSPQTVANMIRDNGDGTCTVTFPGAPDKPMTVSIPTNKPENLTINADYRGTWPQAILDAYVDYRKKYVPGYRDLTAEQIWQKDQEQEAAQLAFKLLANSAPEHNRIRFGAMGIVSRGELGQKLNDQVQHGRPGLLYDRNAGEFRGVLDYDKYATVLTYTAGWHTSSRSLGELSPYPVPQRYALDFDDIYSKTSANK